MGARWAKRVFVVIGILGLVFCGFCVIVGKECTPANFKPKVDVTPLQELVIPADIEGITELIDPAVFSECQVNDADVFKVCTLGPWKVGGVSERTLDECVVNETNTFMLCHFSGLMVGGRWMGSLSLTVELSQFPDIYLAEEEFERKCLFSLERIYKEGGEGENRYCLSHQRREVNEYCAINGYSTEVVFLKGRVVMRFNEYAGAKDSPVLSEVIAYLAEEISRQVSNR